MNSYVRFFNDLTIEKHKIYFKKDDETDNTRYFIAGENKDKYYVCQKVNDTEYNVCCAFSKECEGKMFKVVKEN